MTPRARLAIAAGIGLGAGIFSGVLAARAGYWPDLVLWWEAARVLLAGGDPYQALAGGRPEPFVSPLYYPLPAVLLTTPLAWVPLPLAAACFIALSSGVLAWHVVSREPHRLWLFGSASFVMAVNHAQWAPAILIASYVPWAGALALAKPTIGLAVLAYRPTWRAALSAVALLGLSFAVMPTWFLGWLDNVRRLDVHHPAPILTMPGFILVLAVLRWRRPEARLLLVMACAPQLLMWADQLPLWLVARSKRETMFLSGLSLVSVLGWFVLLAPGDSYVATARPWVLWFVYLPALVLVLRGDPRARGEIE
ncbi:MAG: hypothetical protein M3373_05290 [Gemmatimonadota bacterium]|nr:hypothetical protein [Gemmatimonadota bacterium]